MNRKKEIGAREYALLVLSQVLGQQGYASLIMRNSRWQVSDKDRGLATELVYGVLRNRTSLDYQWEDLLKKHGVSQKTRILIDLGIYQLQYLSRIPAYAVISESVNLASKGDRGFVNAILHKVGERGKRVRNSGDPLMDCAVNTSHPEWILRMWSAQYGQDRALAIAENDQKPHPVYGRVNLLKTTYENLSWSGGLEFVDQESFILHDPAKIRDWFEDGRAVIQDISSQQIAKKLDVQPGMRVLDVCSAPGTKTQQTAVYMKNEGEILAGDIYPERLGLVENLMKKTGVSIVRTKVRDATRADEDLEKMSFDRVLIDAPCSGLGDLSHKPEIRWNTLSSDLDSLQSVQERILNANEPYVKVFGKLVYSTCTLNRKENEKQIEKFLAAHPNYVLNEQKTIFPMDLGGDGFYYALLTKTRE